MDALPEDQAKAVRSAFDYGVSLMKHGYNAPEALRQACDESMPPKARELVHEGLLNYADVQRRASGRKRALLGAAMAAAGATAAAGLWIFESGFWAYPIFLCALGALHAYWGIEEARS